MFNYLHGYGLQIKFDFSICKGEFLDSVLNGQAVMKYSDISISDGTFVNGLLNGQAKQYFYEDNRIVQGYFVEDVPHGFVREYLQDGKIY